VVLSHAFKVAALTFVIVVGVVTLLIIRLTDDAAPSRAVGPTTTSGVFSVAQSSTTVSEGTTSTAPPVEITIAAVGDVMVHKLTLRVARYAAGKAGGYDFKPMVASVAPYLSRADYTVCNLETVMAGSGYGYTGYPQFNSPAELTQALTLCGIDLCATANNHSLDKGLAGVLGTLDRLDQAGIAHVGTYRSPKEKADPFIVNIKGIKVAFINYTNMVNQGPSPNDYSINYLSDPKTAAAEAKAARAAGAEVVIAILHWGREYSPSPSRLQTTWAQGSASYPGLLADGVDVILGSHPHVVQTAVGVRQDSTSGPKNTYVVYSMGNFLSDMSTPPKDRGAIVYVQIKKTGQKVEVTGLSYMGVMIDKVGSYVRELCVVPVLPGVEPAPGTSVSAKRQQRIDSVWAYLTDLLDNPDANIAPLAAADTAGLE
jgi:poly-gamma-glutamate capsule biosynthesis protein CapA/YwtB (metallophosphatase superfamily)